MALKIHCRLEKAEQADGVKLLRFVGAQVYVLGTRRLKRDYQGTIQTPGIPDVHCFLPARGGQCARMLQWEVKRSHGGRVSEAQRVYGNYCLVAGIAYVRGDVAALTAWLLREGYLREGQISSERIVLAVTTGGGVID